MKTKISTLVSCVLYYLIIITGHQDVELFENPRLEYGEILHGSDPDESFDYDPQEYREI